MRFTPGIRENDSVLASMLNRAEGTLSQIEEEVEVQGKLSSKNRGLLRSNYSEISRVSSQEVSKGAREETELYLLAVSELLNKYPVKARA